MSLVAVKPEILDWAIERSGIAIEEIEDKFPKLSKWRNRETSPTISQLEKFARKTQTPLGYLFLSEPPVETLPVPNFRTIRNEDIKSPSPNLIETVQQMQYRSSWMRDFLIERDEEPLSFVGSVDINQDIKFVASNIRETLRLNDNWASVFSTWRDALSGLIKAVDNTGILVMVNGVVGNNNYRKLDKEEFRGFVLIDEFAPLIFVNGSDFKGAQMFTIAHELAHVWLGKGAIFNLRELQPHDNEIENFCNKVAAEFLVPETLLRKYWKEEASLYDSCKKLSGKFKVSPIVIGRRALDLGYVVLNDFLDFYSQYKDEVEEKERQKKEKKKSGGDFYNNQNFRIGKKFASAVFMSAKEGKLPYRTAFKLTGLKGKTFDEYSQRLGIKQ